MPRAHAWIPRQVCRKERRTCVYSTVEIKIESSAIHIVYRYKENNCAEKKDRERIKDRFNLDALFMLRGSLGDFTFIRM